MVKGTLNISAAIDFVALSSVSCHHFEQWSCYLITVCQSTKNHLVRLSSAIILFLKHVFVIGMKSITFDSTHVQVCHHDTYPCWDCPMCTMVCCTYCTNPTCPFSFITSLWTIFLSGFSTGLSPVLLACSCPNYASPSLDPWDCPLDSPCVPCMFLSHLSIPFPWSMGLSHGLSSVSLACSCPNYPSASLDPWDCPMDCLLCPLHAPVPTINPLPLIHGIVPWTVFCVPCMFLSQLSIHFCWSMGLSHGLSSVFP